MRILLLLFLVSTNHLWAQSSFEEVQKRLKLLSEKQGYQKADISFCLVDTKSGKVIFNHQADKLLAPASTLKTYTTATALKLLGPDYRYKTKFVFEGIQVAHQAYGTLWVYSSGDPSLGSDRYTETKAELIKNELVSAFKKKGITHWQGNIRLIPCNYTDTPINKNWLDEDVGNYYGAGIYPLNWRENKFELTLEPTKNSFKVIRNTGNYNNDRDFCISVEHKDEATTEEVFAYIEQKKWCKFHLKGVLSAKEKSFNLQLASIRPDVDFITELESYFKKNLNFIYTDTILGKSIKTELYTHTSPPLNKLVYWCNQKSLNLYAESFCKTIALIRFKKGNWLLGTGLMSKYAEQLSIKNNGMHLDDGSGLSENNRITTRILSSLLAKYTKESFYPIFYESLPSINGLNMKSGYIGGTRAYAGYITLKDSTTASFAFIIHGYDIKPKEVKVQMFQILDLLKAN